MRDLTQHLTAQADDNHASSVSAFPKALLSFKRIHGMSSPGKESKSDFRSSGEQNRSSLNHENRVVGEQYKRRTARRRSRMLHPRWRKSSGRKHHAAGAVAKLIAKEGKSATLKLPSREVRLISKNCSAIVRQVGNVGVNQKSLSRAGSKRWLGKSLVVRGVVMNPVDNPHGGGEGRAPIGRKKTITPWGYPALGKRTRKRNKYSDNLILRRRSK
ncbi:ribosomal protein L2 [Tanacetum coccineum]|uniref:Ribosomal protein L2 n=1 Tax=Tanacetum coccineum TaxID=301880 RepID=A0ABQ4X573_9ASTR